MALPDKWRFPAEVEGWLTPGEGRALALLAQDKVVAEIGSWCGKSTVSMAQVAKKVHAVDWFRGDDACGFRETLPDLWHNLKRYGLLDKVAIHIGKSVDVAPLLRHGAFQMTFVDGAHDYDSVRDDTLLALLLTTKGGVLAFHDFNYESVQKAVASLLGERPPENVVDALAWFLV